MDLVSTVRKSGSRGGVNFSWDEVANSSHRENYLGHSLKAPVGRWQQGRDLNWYAKAEGSDKPNESGETDAERMERERKEEVRRIKEAEEDAMARAMGLPPPQRDTSGANAVEVGPQRRAVGPASGDPDAPPAGPDDETSAASKSGRSRGHDDDDDGRERRRHRHHHRRHDRSRSRSRDRRRRHHRSRSRDPERRHRHHEHGRHRDRSPGREGRSERRHRRERSRSRGNDAPEGRRRERSKDGYRSRSRERRDHGASRR